MNILYFLLIIIPGLFLLVGLIFLILGIAIMKNSRKKENKCTCKTFGKVVNIIKRSNRNMNEPCTYYWHPVFEYYVGNLKVVKESIYGNAEPKYTIGQSVEIYYNPENYNEYIVGGDKTASILGKIFTIVGILCLISAMISLAIITICICLNI